MKTSRKVISLLLSLIMVMTTFVVAAPLLVNAADITIDGVSQSRVVETKDELYKRRYAGYASDFLGGASEPTDIVIPGLLNNDSNNYVIQGMTYYADRDWMLVTAYHAPGTASSKVFALDAATGEFAAMFSFRNVPDAKGNRTINKDHGGGIAVSEHNIYYACGDQDRKIAYAPISAIANAPLGQHTVIDLVAEKEFYEVGSVVDDSGNSAYTAYCCYDQGVLWTGNFFDPGVWGLIAADYKMKANDDWDNMLWGYRLSGSSSEEEWANLTGATGKDCQGNPSYAIALADGEDDLDVKNVQYATVDNGKLYLSRSYGTGKGTRSVSVGRMDEYSHLTIADIDLSVPGNTTVTYLADGAGTTKTINTAYTINKYEDHAIMPMSEGLCVIDDYVYMTFESASPKYLHDSDVMGNCQMPVDVIWKIDQYELMGEERPNEERAVHYKQVNTKAEITDGEEYIIAYESDEIDPTTLKPYLYLLDSNGGYKDFKLAKRKATDSDGYAGLIAKPIIDYSIENGELYFYDADNDEIPGIRWTITGANSGNLRMQNASTYFSEFRNFYFDSSVIAMAADDVSGLSNMFIDENGEGDGGFYIRNGGYYLWCNDGVTSDYTAKANAWYASNTNAMYSGVTETKGTFHCDALNTTGANLIGKQVDDADHRTFYIFKRVVDEYISTKDSRVHTNMNAELQADGTYTIDLETYATGEMQYQILEQERPTDFIFVLDTSASMTNNSDGSGYINYGENNTLQIYYLVGRTNSYTEAGAPGEVHTYGAGVDIYYRTKDYDFCSVYVAVRTHSREYSVTWPVKAGVKSIEQRYWCYYIDDEDGLCYFLYPDGSASTTGITYDTLKSYVDAGTNFTAKNTNKENTHSSSEGSSDRCDTVLYKGSHYRYGQKEITRLEMLKQTVEGLTYKIADIATDELNHRIAVVQYGSDGKENWLNTGMYNNSSTTMVQYTGQNSIDTSNYANAFYDVENFGTVRTIINSLNTDGGDSDTYSNYGFEMAKNIILNSGQDYLATGDRSVAIIMLTDGVPGLGGSDSNSANTVADASVAEAYIAKSKGATVYSVQLGNNSIDNFSMNLYMEAVSSEYVTAKSTLDLGEENPNDVDYHIDVDLANAEAFDNLLSGIYTSIQENTKFGLAHLITDSILREQLTDAFLFPEDWTVEKNVSYQFTSGSYDKIGRLSWGTPVTATGLTTDVSKKDRRILVSGYNYSDEYIGKLHPGDKLTVTITNVLANPVADITNTSINNTDTTAIYADVNWYNSGRVFKYFPTKYFNIPEYTYVLDYGLEMLDTAVNGTLCSVSDGPTKQVVADYEAKLPYTQKSANGLVAITDENQNLLYTTTPTNFADSGYCFIQRDNGRYDWFSIKVVPASNVLFEEDYMNNSGTGVSWTKDGTTKKGYQTLTNELTDVYGYDGAYADSVNGHSYGSADKATVSATAKRSVTKTFDFGGDGIDLISACGPNTGIMIVKISGGDLEKPKAYIVDTYYGDSAVKGLVCQTPIVNFRGNHGTYTVEATAAYLSSAGAVTKSVTGTTSKGKLEATTGVPVSEADTKALLAELGMADLANADLELVWFDDNSVLNGGTGAKGNVKTARDGSTVTSLDCYLDGFRIYHPMKTANDDYIANEKHAQYINVLDNKYIGSGSTELRKIAYVTGDLKADENGVIPSLSFANYQNVGPQNELYLAGDKTATDETLVLQVSLPAPTSRVHLGLRAVTGTASVKIGGVTFPINSATEMYYDVTDCVSVDEYGVATITIQNSGSNLLAVNNIKLTGDATAIDLEESALEKAALSMAADPVEAEVVNGVVTPVEEDTDTDTDVGTDTDTDGDTGSSNLSFIEQIIAKIMEFLSSIFQFLPVGEVA